MAPSPPAPAPAPPPALDNPYNLLPPKHANPQYWRHASLAAFLLTCFLAPATDSWSTTLRRACWMAYWMTYLDTSYKDGSRAWPWFQRMGIWRMYCGYLQVRGERQREGEGWKEGWNNGDAWIGRAF
jgi:hypothetical protein